MVNEIQEFYAYTHFPEYTATGKRDTAWMGRFTFPMLLDFEGMGRILTTVARGYLFQQGDPYENTDYARDALCAWCSVPERKRATPREVWQFGSDFRELHRTFPELVDENGNGWFFRHVKNMIQFARKNPDLVSKPNQKNAEALAKGFTAQWKRKLKQMQVPAFAINTKAAWGLRFDDILADALELGPLQKYEISLSQQVINGLKAHTPKGFPDTLLPMLMEYYLAHGGETEEWVILPVSAVDAYYGSTTFSRKKKQLPKEIFQYKESYGICKFKMNIP